MNFRHFFLPITFFAFLFIYGCHDSRIDPYEDETGIYSIYGALNINEMEHVIRVRDLSVVHNDSSSANLDVAVIFHDLEAGTSQVLRDSVLQFPTGYTHNFILNQELKPRTTYQVTVEGSEGNTASSTFTTPGITRVLVLPLDTPINCSRNFRIDFENLLPTEIIRLEIGFEYQESIHWFEPNLYCADIEYEESLQQLLVHTTPLFLLNEVFPSRVDVPWIDCNQAPSPRVRCSDLDSETAYLRHLHLGPEWNKVYPNYPSDPLDIQAVANGLGFLGAYYDGVTTYHVISD